MEIKLGQIDHREFDLGEIKAVILPPKTEQVVVEPSLEEQVFEPSGKGVFIDRVTARAVTAEIDENITPLNIRKGVSVLGVEGNLEPDKPNQSKSVVPSTSAQVVVADSGYELEKVTVEAIPIAVENEELVFDNIGVVEGGQLVL